MVESVEPAAERFQNTICGALLPLETFVRFGSVVGLTHNYSLSVTADVFKVTGNVNRKS